MSRWLLLSLLLLGAVRAAHAQTSGPGGLYVVCNPTDADDFTGAPSHLTACQNALAQGSIPNCGMWLNLSWNDLETSLGTYNWNGTMGSGAWSADKYMATAKAAGCKILIAINGGELTPSWVASSPTSAPYTPACGSEYPAMPIPWSTQYLGAYNAAMTALGAHLSTVANPLGGTVDVRANTKIVILGGAITLASAEFHLPVDTGVCTGGTISMDTTWQQSGFTPSQVITAENSVLSNASTAFSTGNGYGADLEFGWPTISPNGFPPIDNNGTMYTAFPMVNDKLTGQFISSVLTNGSYSGRRFLFLWNALSNVPPIDSLPAYAVIVAGANFQNADMGWQFNERGGPPPGASSGTQCNYSGTFAACNGTNTGTVVGDYKQILDQCVLIGSRVCAYWGANIALLQSSISINQANSIGLPQ